MKFVAMALGVAMAAGCAHGSGTRAASRETRGSARVADVGRLLVAGPADTVHASVEGRGVSLFLVDRVHGDDRDCHDVTYAQWVTTSAHVEVGAKQELCAVTRGGDSLVIWHAFGAARSNLWALQ